VLLFRKKILAFKVLFCCCKTWWCKFFVYLNDLFV